MACLCKGTGETMFAATVYDYDATPYNLTPWCFIGARDINAAFWWHLAPFNVVCHYTTSHIGLPSSRQVGNEGR